ncbi:MAG: ATP cone domain-containing protein [Candidatus Andersenbacteria bacterium]|nr:ATP cone domain-containing protein [bacterium]MDZ4225743.1 ATP cone domain-containing protein [Candidatus Andersenbacteria bacterium]
MYITKARGNKEPFSEEKIHSSSLRAGASSEVAMDITRRVQKKIKPGVSSDKIYEQVVKGLQQHEPALAARYSLKRAIMKMGPTGYPFEQYIAAVLREHGYGAEVGQIMSGECVQHEVDILARREKKNYLIECKYHNQPGTRSDIKVPLYVYARFLDVKKKWDESHVGDPLAGAWVVTNTKVTQDAVMYCKCVGMRVIAWRYPGSGGLEQLIESKKLYPLTVLPSLSSAIWIQLARCGIVLVRDLLRFDSVSLSRKTGLAVRSLGNIRAEAQQLLAV